MVMLVWWILSLCGVCEFTWLPVFIDAALTCAMSMFGSQDDSMTVAVSADVALGAAYFAFLKYFFGLTISGWWILAAPIVSLIVFIFPGGFTIVNLLFQHFGWMQVPTWGLITGIVVDVILLALLVFAIIDSRQK